jgi:KDO2-lipid IV(A) lauroyltransferase
METLWCFGANKDKIYSKVEITNMNVFEDIFLSKKNATILLSHIGNWELFCQWSSLFIPKLRVVTLFTPIKNALLNDIIQSFRGRFGTVMISTKSTLNLYRAQKTNFPCINLFAVDQNPGAPDEQLWLDFFNKKVPVISGAEKFAKSLEQEVYFLHIEKRNKKYELRLEKIDYEIESDNDVTKKQMKLLENNILKDPSLWLLSHNRFKFLK